MLKERNIRKQLNQLSSYFKKSVTDYEKIDKKNCNYSAIKLRSIIF